MRDQARSTYSRAGPSGARLRAHTAPPDPQRVAALLPDLADRCARYLSQSFDLLGSGWRTATHGVACDGFERRRCPPSAIRPDARGAWLAGQVSRPNLAEARAVWRLLDPAYRPVDWHLDFRSGYRWSPLSWYRRVPYGHLAGVDVKLPWELARMQHLPQLALAFGCARAGVAEFLPPERYRDGFRNQVLDFVATNPPRWGVNWCSTMEVAMRVANWLLAYDLLRGYGGGFDREFETVLVRSVREHGRHIARNLDRSPAWRNNHYLAGLAGLIFVAAYLPPTRETHRWWRTAVPALHREGQRQFHPDGTHFEASTGYHALAAQLVTYAVAMTVAGRRGADLPGGPAAQEGLPDALRDTFVRMAEFLIDMTGPDGRLVQIGDQDSGRLFKLQPIPRDRPGGRLADGTARPAPNEEHLDAGPVIAGINGLLGGSDIPEWRSDRWIDAWVVAGLAGRPGGRASEVPPAESRAAQAASRLRPGFERLSDRLRTDPAIESAQVVLATPGASLRTGMRASAYPDFGAYILRSDRLFLCLRAGFARLDGTGGHAHADQLSLEVGIDGMAWLRDPGSYVYTASPRQRNAYRSSAAHFVPYVLEGEAALWSRGLFDLELDVRLCDIAIEATGIAVDLRLAGNRIGQVVTVDAQQVTVETWIFEHPRGGGLRARCRRGYAGHYRFQGEPMHRDCALLPRVRAAGSRRGARRMRILHVVGTRPNFVKAAPVMRALDGVASQKLVHTGQHYDAGMSRVFFDELGLRRPDVDLEVGAGTQTAQTGRILLRLEPLFGRFQPDACVVYGDVTSTLAAALAAAQHQVRLAHVEAGLRSRDWTMPEERNRTVTDCLADWLFTPSEDANDNLRREGVPASRIHLVGNVMIDTLVRLLPSTDPAAVLPRFGIAAGDPCALVTLHRPSTVDAPGVFEGILGVLAELSTRLPVVFPVHPRTRARLDVERWRTPGFHLTNPLGYLDFLSLERAATVVVTDSGGVQEEATYLGVPCLTVRDTTERPITVTAGTNTVVGRDPERLRAALWSVLDAGPRRGWNRPDLWDGQTAERIAAVLTGEHSAGCAGR